MQIEALFEDRAIIGESPLWSADEGALYWIDIKAPALYRWHMASGARRSWSLSSDCGGFALMAGGALVALRYGLYRLDFATGACELLAPPPYDPAIFRFNEGACDAAGRFWIGVMCDPLDGATEHRKSALHSFTVAGGLRAEADASDLHNGMAWSADNTRFFLAHSFAQEIDCFDYVLDGGLLSNRRRFACVASEHGIPDGAAVDVEGGYWSALHGGGLVRRFHPDGSVDRDIALPVSQPTMCAFGGPDLATLFVTSASEKLTAAQRRDEPLAGAVFKLDPKIRGIARRSHLR